MWSATICVRFCTAHDASGEYLKIREKIIVKTSLSSPNHVVGKIILFAIILTVFDTLICASEALQILVGNTVVAANWVHFLGGQAIAVLRQVLIILLIAWMAVCDRTEEGRTYDDWSGWEMIFLLFCYYVFISYMFSQLYCDDKTISLFQMDFSLCQKYFPRIEIPLGLILWVLKLRAYF